MRILWRRKWRDAAEGLQRAERAVSDAQAAVRSAEADTGEARQLADWLRTARQTNHFSERYARMLRQGYGRPHPRGGS